MSTKSLNHKNNNWSRSTLLTLSLLVILRSSLRQVHGLVAIDSNRCQKRSHSSYEHASNSPQSINSSDINENQLSTKPMRWEERPNEIHHLHRQVRTQRNHFNTNRRAFLMAVSAPFLLASPQKSDALPFFDESSRRRQLELCLVTVLRTQYWAMNVAKSIKYKLFTPTTTTTTTTTTSTEHTDNITTEAQRKQPYLEARLGAKALLTQKIGGGSNANVLKLSSFHIKECLDDGKYWCDDARRIENGAFSSPREGRRVCRAELALNAENLVEALASLVEFDGLENTVDPSPRSSLMLSMYTPQKGEFVYRTLMERVIPACEGYLNVFPEKREFVLEFVRREYSEEIPLEVLERLYAGSES